MHLKRALCCLHIELMHCRDTTSVLLKYAASIGMMIQKSHVHSHAEETYFFILYIYVFLFIADKVWTYTTPPSYDIEAQLKTQLMASKEQLDNLQDYTNFHSCQVLDEKIIAAFTSIR